MSGRRIAAIAGTVALLALVGCGGDHHTAPRSTEATPPAPGPIIGRRTSPQHDPLSAADRVRATAAVRRFLAGYVPYLYGRGRPGRVRPVTTSVARTLRRSHGRITPAQAAKHPRVIDVTLAGQTDTSALTTVTIADGGPAPYRLTVTVERRSGRWEISDLGDNE